MLRLSCPRRARLLLHIDQNYAEQARERAASAVAASCTVPAIRASHVDCPAKPAPLQLLLRRLPPPAYAIFRALSRPARVRRRDRGRRPHASQRRYGCCHASARHARRAAFDGRAMAAAVANRIPRLAVLDARPRGLRAAGEHRAMSGQPSRTLRCSVAAPHHRLTSIAYRRNCVVAAHRRSPE